MTKKQENTIRLFDRLSKLGFTYDEITALLRIERTLHRWAEQSCGDGNDYASWSIQRDEETGKPFKCVYPHNAASHRYPIADREAGALRRLATIMEPRKRRLVAYHQTDPRGCAIYIVRRKDIPAGANLDSCYTNGIAVCV